MTHGGDSHKSVSVSESPASAHPPPWGITLTGPLIHFSCLICVSLQSHCCKVTVHKYVKFKCAAEASFGSQPNINVFLNFYSEKNWKLYIFFYMHIAI